MTSEEVVRRLAPTGLDAQFVIKRLAPHRPGLTAPSDEPETKFALAYEAAGVISRVFGWPTRDILDTKGKALTPVVPEGRFKAPASTALPRVKAYAAYIRPLSLLVADACAHCPQASLSADPVELRHFVMAAYGSFTLDAWGDTFGI